MSSDPEILLEPLTAERSSTLAQLFELYAYDFSEHMPLQLKPSGRFELAPGDQWWTRDDHFAFLIHCKGALAGFALVRTGSRVTAAPDVMDVAEFFVARGLRRDGVGRRVAHALFQRFPRTWEVRVRRTNVGALQFWSRAVDTWVKQPVAVSPFTSDGVEWDILRFDA